MLLDLSFFCFLTTSQLYNNQHGFIFQCEVCFLFMHVEMTWLVFIPVLSVCIDFMDEKKKKKKLLFNLQSQILVYYLMCTITCDIINKTIILFY